MNGSCFFTKGWLQFAKETEIQEGDVLLLYKGEENGNTLLNVCIFKAEDCAACDEKGISLMDFFLNMLSDLIL